MCEGCGCHNLWVKPKRSEIARVVAPGAWHVHADGTAHRHDHGHSYRLVSTRDGHFEDSQIQTSALLEKGAQGSSSDETLPDSLDQ